MIGDVVEFGRYPRKQVTKKTLLAELFSKEVPEVELDGVRYYWEKAQWFQEGPLYFVVIAENEESLTLICCECIDKVIYAEDNNISYEESFVRKWIQSTFIKRAFNEQERSQILVASLPDTSNIIDIPQEFIKCKITDYASLDTPSKVYWTKSVRYGVSSGSFQDNGPLRNEVITIDAQGPCAGDIYLHSTDSLGYPELFRPLLKLKKG